MATTTTTGFHPPACSQTTPVVFARSNRRRRITPQAGRALEIFAHAIEYLSDEIVHQGLAFSANDGQLQAVQMLMALNRQVYFECPEVPTFAERCRAFLHRQSA